MSANSLFKPSRPAALPRQVDAETLDQLDADDPRAQRSRRDLRRLHRWMGSKTLLLRALRTMDTLADLAPMAAQAGPLRVLELGAGDGSLMLSVARALAPAWPAVELTLLDRQALVADNTVAHYAELGWIVARQNRDALDWAASANHALQFDGQAPRWDLIVANLFVHHFDAATLTRLLAGIAASSDRFVALEPRRHWLALAASHGVGAIGANAVTREDAVLSVHAGFCGQEISVCWPAQGETWQLHEHAAGLFSHCFVAQRARHP